MFRYSFWAMMASGLMALALVADERPAIEGKKLYKPHELVRLRATNIDDKAALLWRIYPSKGVHRATTPRGILEFSAHPGTYDVELLVIRSTGDALSVEEAGTQITVESCLPPTPSPPAPSPPTPGKPNAAAALGRIQFGSAGCTATVIGPRRPDGRWDVLTAAHCVSGPGERGRLTLKDGRSFTIRVITHQRTPDLSWCVTDEDPSDLPFARIAGRNPEPGTRIWHAGYGVDKPGNREEGTVTAAENHQGQLRMTLSVSSGDSGGGIFRVDSDELISVVCCTTGTGQRVAMWGGSAEVANRSRPRATEEGWIPLPIPIIPKMRAEP